MRTEHVRSWAEYLEIVNEYTDGSWLFRGVSSASYVLQPSIGRKRLGGGYSAKLERDVFARFKREALPYLTFQPVDDWDWLALAQHHGVPTRLIDWSESPMVATFFAVANSQSNSDAVVFIMRMPRSIDTGMEGNPFSVETISFFHPAHVTRRIAAQKGVFTIHPRPYEEFNDDSLTKSSSRGVRKSTFRSTWIHLASITLPFRLISTVFQDVWRGFIRSGCRTNSSSR